MSDKTPLGRSSGRSSSPFADAKRTDVLEYLHDLASSAADLARGAGEQTLAEAFITAAQIAEARR